MKDAYQLIVKVSALVVGLLVSIALLVLILIASLVVSFQDAPSPISAQMAPSAEKATSVANTYRGVIPNEGLWRAPDWATLENEPNASLIAYGRELIVNTSEHLGPNGKVLKISNGMDCQNCHLDAGTAPLGNNYGAVFSTYPKLRGRSGQMEDIPKRINDCFERSLNGQPLDEKSNEMLAMVAYMQWLGKDVPKGEIPHGSGIYEVPLLERAADPVGGQVVYAQLCQSCHMEDGKGMMKPDQTGYVYPPLWGAQSYNNGAGLYRMSRFAGYVKTNMPLGATFERPMLTDEQAWDVAAYVNSMTRPEKDLSRDWPDISKKPVDHPFGPFSDEFSAEQHKFGPFKPIIAFRENPTK
ncbi:MAG: c-type cytochrome [Lunatimonas sp.]|uniref:c-type cytochrome n=1 Tax=Lunatimonas sp. TaxID=2060141 RepID=UPI00263B6BD4|nr:c-type cytochrome [Lunatimonas sp.]MCC5938673.1 c-type cytochrome [Lunatimonas sp.]